MGAVSADDDRQTGHSGVVLIPKTQTDHETYIDKGIELGGAGAAAAGSTSCLNEYLDKAPDAGLDEKEVFSKYANFKSYFYAVYNGANFNIKAHYPQWFAGNNQKFTMEGLTDMCDMTRIQRCQPGKQGDGSTVIYAVGYNSDASSKTAKVPYSWKSIRVANMTIRNIDMLQDATDREKKDLLAQAYFVRAYCHFELFRLYGSLPYIDKVMGSEDEWDLPRLSDYDMLQRIAADFQTAADIFDQAGLMRRDPASGSGHLAATDQDKPNGVTALVVQHDIDLSTVPGAAVLKVESSRYALALMSGNLFGNPSRRMTMIGVTGTKGKTTTTHMIKSVLEAAGRKVGMIGTNGIYFLGHHQETANTTPESYELQKTFREFLDAGCDTALMEVSSQGLMMDRVAGIHYDIGVFTNISPDHIGPGEHKTFEEYRSWKGQLFKRCTTGVVNIDDENTEALLEGHTCKLVTYGRSEKADYRAEGCELLRTHDFLGVAFHVSGKDDMDVRVNMPGEFSVYNALAALAVGKVLGLPDAAIHEGLGKCVVKGRVELVPISKKFTILLDYAHNEVSTESLLTTLRAYKPHRLVVVFGCGGNRSKLRRYGMGETCAKMADFSILTEDNNRFEKVEDILADIRVGMNKGNPDAKFVEIPDRLDALHYAVDHAQEGDLIAVIGKGHETYRDRMGVKTPFLERELLEEYAQQIGLE